MKLTKIINSILIKFKIQKRIIVFIINNANNNDILYHDLIKHFLISQFNNSINIKNDKFLQSL